MADVVVVGVEEVGLADVGLGAGVYLYARSKVFVVEGTDWTVDYETSAGRRPEGVY